MFMHDYGLATRGDTKQLTRAQRNLRRRLGDVRRERAQVDAAQDARLDALEEENESLQVCLSTLLSLLASKGILSEDEWLTIAEITQDVEDRRLLELIEDDE